MAVLSSQTGCAEAWQQHLYPHLFHPVVTRVLGLTPVFRSDVVLPASGAMSQESLTLHGCGNPPHFRSPSSATSTFPVIVEDGQAVRQSGWAWRHNHRHQLQTLLRPAP